MNFQQLRSIRETARCGFNLTEVANVLFTSQPGVSRQIRELEDELGVEIFERNGKRLVGLTEPGKGILHIVERILLEANNLRQASSEYAGEKNGTLTIATTHTQARYSLPEVVHSFRTSFPQVRVALQQSAPEHIAEAVVSGKADIGIATEGLSQFKDLASFPCYSWNHVVVVPENHPLLAIRGPLSLKDLAAYPLITYDIGFTGRSHIDDAFRAANIDTDIVLTAMDSDVIQQYVALGLGVGIVASMAIGHGAKHLQSIDVPHLFAPNITRLAVRKGAYLRAYAYNFIQQFAPELTKAEIDAAINEPVAQ
jgi:LysR family cys regulon transcriptional activator